jgi:hypothetical protein
VIRLWHVNARTELVNVFRASREGAFVIVEGVARITPSRAVGIKVLCCRGSDRHLYPRHVFSLHRHDASTWHIEPGPHVVQDGPRALSVVNDAIELCGVPNIDLFDMPENP